MEKRTTVPSAFSALLRECREAFGKGAWPYFAPLVVGLVLAGQAKLCSHVYEFSGIARHWTGHYRFFSAYQWCPVELARIILRLIVATFGSECCQLVVDDTFVLKVGQKIFGVCWHGDYRPGSRWCRWAHNWVVIGVSVRFPSLRRAIFFPLSAVLYVRRKYCPRGIGFKTRHALAGELIVELQKGLETPLNASGDGAYAARQLIRTVTSCGANWISRLRKDAEIYEPEPRRRKGPGRPSPHGKRLLCPGQMVKRGRVKYEAVGVEAYGRRQKVEVYTRLVWWKATKSIVRLVIVKGMNGSKKPFFLFSTDPGMTPREIIEGFSGRWPIEQSFRDGKQMMGLGRTQMRRSVAITRYTSFGLVVQSLVKLWYIREHGVERPENVMPWYQHKKAPSFGDMLRTLQHRLRTPAIFRKSLGKPTQLAKLPAAARSLSKTGTDC